MNQQMKTTQFEGLKRKKEMLELLSALQQQLIMDHRTSCTWIAGTTLDSRSRTTWYLGFECEPRHAEQPIAAAMTAPLEALRTLAGLALPCLAVAPK